MADINLEEMTPDIFVFRISQGKKKLLSRWSLMKFVDTM